MTESSSGLTTSTAASLTGSVNRFFQFLCALSMLYCK